MARLGPEHATSSFDRDALTGALAPGAVTVVGALAGSELRWHLIDNLLLREECRLAGALHPGD